MEDVLEESAPGGRPDAKISGAKLYIERPSIGGEPMAQVQGLTIDEMQELNRRVRGVEEERDQIPGSCKD